MGDKSYDMQPYLRRIDEVIEQGPFKDTWDSLCGFRPPEWLREAKFGIFIHWGVYSVPAYANEWYSRNMYIRDSDEYQHHIKTFGKHTEFGYKDFIPMFTAERFNADEWVELFQKAGAKYVVPVAEHHDGFQMYKSEISHWNAYEMGPKRDVLGELRESCARRGLPMGASSHRMEHWFFMGHGKEFESDIRDPMKRGDFYWPAMPERDHQDIFSEPEPTEEFLQDWLVRTCEIIDRYRPPMLYFDWWIQHSTAKPYLKKVAAYYYNRGAQWGVQTAISYKHDAFFFGTAVPDVERGQFADMKPYLWQADTAIARNSWCYTEQNVNKSAAEILCDLADIVSKNGCMLLNVGPKADGTISDKDREVLLEIGDWLRVNGEAIYGTNVFRKYGEGPTQVEEGQFSDGNSKNFTSEDFRFTTGNGYLYAIALKASEDGNYCIRALGEQDAARQANFHGIIRQVEVLGGGSPEWSRDESGLHIRWEQKSERPIVFRVRID